MKTVKTMVLGLVALILTNVCVGVARADEATPVKATDAFALDFAANVDFYDFDDGLWVLTPSAGFELFEVLDATVSLPIYYDSETTGLGDVNFDVEYGLSQCQTGLFGADKSTLSLNGGVGVPFGGDYASDNLTFNFGGEIGLNWGKVGLNQTASYLLITGDDTFAPVFGGFVEDNIFSATTSLDIAVTDKLTIGVDFLQAYSGDSKYMTVGPAVSWEISKACNLDLAVGFAVQQEDMPYGDNDFTVKGGLSFEF